MMLLVCPLVEEKDSTRVWALDSVLSGRQTERGRDTQRDRVVEYVVWPCCLPDTGRRVCVRTV